MKNTGWILCAFLFITITGQSQVTSTKANYDQILADNFVEDGPGVSALVAKDGKIIYSGAIGQANLELGIPARPDHVFRIGSITKQFTAVAILMLEEQGKLHLQDEITKYLSDYPTQGKQITIEHLLTHTSGIQSYTGMTNFGEVADQEMSREEMVDVFKNEPMEFDPGTDYKYNNSGYFLLGVIIEKISGQSYAEFLQEHIFDKVAMENSYYGNFEQIIKNRAAGYMQNEDGYFNATYLNMEWPYAAGSLLSTVGDLLKWNTTLHAGKLIKKETLAKAFETYKLVDGKDTGYGYGWSMSQLHGSPTYEHGGGINGFLTQGIYLPKEKIYVAVFSNCNCQRPNLAALQLATEAMGKSKPKTSSVKLNKTAMEEYVGIYQIPGKDKRTITLEDGQLYSARGAGKYMIQSYAKDQFSIEGSLTTFEFIRNAAGKIVEMKSHTRDGNHEVAKRTDEKPMVRTAIEVDEKILTQYVGTYALAPSFKIEVTKENGLLYTQATGQQKFPLFAESETRFFLKVVDAQVEFIKDDTGNVTKLILYQAGQEVPGIKE